MAVQATVAPSRGPVHGVDSTAVKTPMKNEPPAVSLVGLKTVSRCGQPNFEQPNHTDAHAADDQSQKAASHHFSNCSPQSSRSNNPPTPAIKMPRTP